MNESKIPKFRRCVIQNFPFIEEDFDALTDYGLLCKVVQYLNMVIDKVNDLSKLEQEFSELESYVENYFANLDVQDEINAKLEDMAESGDLATIIAEFLELAPIFGYETISDMASATNLSNGSIARVLGNSSAAAGDGAFYLIRTRQESDDPDGFNLVAIGDSLVGARIQNADVEEVNDRIDGLLIESDIVVKSGYMFNNFFNMIKIPKAKINMSLVMSDSYTGGIYQYIKNMTNAIFANGPLHGPTINNGNIITASPSSDDIYLYFLGIDNNGDFKYTKDSNRSLTANDLVSLGYKTVFPIFYPIVLNGIAFDYNTELSGLINDTAKHPRTVFGYDDTYVYIVAIEGRSQRSLGIAYEDMAAFCQSLGIDNAFNLDGGGSTQIWLTNPAFNIVNQDSSSYGYGYSSRKVYGLIKMEIQQ